MLNYAVFGAIAAYIVFLPTTGAIPFLSWHDDQRLMQIALLSLAAVYCISKLAIEPRFAREPAVVFLPRQTIIALTVVLCLGMVSSALAPIPRWALVEWSVTVLLIALSVAVAALRRHLGNRFDRLCLGVLLFTAIAFLLKVAAAYTAAIVERLPLHIGWLLDGFSNPRFFGHFQAMTLPLLVLPAMFWAKTPLSRTGFALLPALWWMLSIASGTRGTWLAMVTACAVVLLCARRNATRWITWQLVTFLSGLAAYWLFFFVIPGLVSLQADTVNRLPDIANLSFRDVLWKRAFEYVVAYPVLGIGPMHFAYYPNPIAAHPHMSLLQWAAEWGLPSAIIMLGIVLYAGMSYVRQLQAAGIYDDEAYALRLALLASLSAAGAQSLVDGVIVMPYSQTLLAIICGWALATHQGNALVAPQVGRWVALGGAVVISLSTVFLLWGIFPEVLDVVNRVGISNTSVVQEGVLLKPRFWSNGWICSEIDPRRCG